ncbi:pyridoxal phosphate-dependent aminotransferase [Kitasatospora sp. NPDC050543]|uniref:pyridoxal phosphate-dependent aminotransferase n=1 Tax=Kitasatospora sp. NPDC050543 TaxID=3364054 RepID=UPI00379633B5
MVETYSIQKWLFESANGRYDIDLAASGVQFLHTGDVRIADEWPLNYSLDRGLPELREAVARLYGGAVRPDSGVLIAHGAQEALYLCYRTLLSPGDHVIATVPGWQQSWAVPRHIGCDVSLLAWTPGEAFDPRRLAELIRPDTRLIVLNSPGNPSGCLIRPEEWARITELAAANGSWILSDEEFALDLDGSVINGYDRAISVSGLSKTYGLPGLRLGWAAGASPEAVELLELMVNYKRYTTMCNSPLSERIAVDVLAERERHLARYRELLAAGRTLLDGFAAEHADAISLVAPEGTPFAWLRLPGRTDSTALAERLLAEHRVLVMPAEVFGAEHGVRLTYARPQDVLAEGLARFGQLLRPAR